uniref:Tc1-like transposase DDE domain-containing protein n=1 Tax=Cyprinus carpio carpio TaxID=630221 RepID=A0A8C1DVJ0_CYPCA
MFSDESKFCISFGYQGPRAWRKRGEAHKPHFLRSSVKFPQSVMVWGAMSSAGVGPLYFLRSKVNTAVYQEVLEHFMLPAADQLYGDADFIFQQDLAPAHSAKATSTWYKDHGIPILNWPANSPDLNPIENLWGIVKRKMRYARPNNAEELKANIRATWALITPEQCHRLIDSMPCCIAAVIQAKGVCRCQVLLENEICISISWSAAGSMKCSKTSWCMAALTLDLRKHSGPTPADGMAPQTITDCGNFTLDLKQHGLCASPLFLQTLGP